MLNSLIKNNNNINLCDQTLAGLVSLSQKYVCLYTVEWIRIIIIFSDVCKTKLFTRRNNKKKVTQSLSVLSEISLPEIFLYFFLLKIIWIGTYNNIELCIDNLVVAFSMWFSNPILSTIFFCSFVNQQNN